MRKFSITLQLITSWLTARRTMPVSNVSRDHANVIDAKWRFLRIRRTRSLNSCSQHLPSRKRGSRRSRSSTIRFFDTRGRVTCDVSLFTLLIICYRLIVEFFFLPRDTNDAECCLGRSRNTHWRLEESSMSDFYVEQTFIDTTANVHWYSYSNTLLAPTKIGMKYLHRNANVDESGSLGIKQV